MARSAPRNAGTLRIIAGRWRGRRLPVVDAGGLRPTADRVRETLFNWLAPVVPGSRCLDLYAGTGALGFEALSRGAAHCVFVERARGPAEALRAACRALQAGDAAEVVQADADAWLKRDRRRFDLVFLDPPFADDALARSCAAVADEAVLAPGGLVYVETDAAADLPVPGGFRLRREARAGQVRFGLLERDPEVGTNR